MAHRTGTQSGRRSRSAHEDGRDPIEAAIGDLNARRGRLVAERRKTLGLSQGRLSREAGVDQSAISLVERGRVSMTTRTAVLLAPVLGLTVESLLIGVDLDPHALTVALAGHAGGAA